MPQNMHQQLSLNVVPRNWYGNNHGLFNNPVYWGVIWKAFIPATVACTVHVYCFIALLCHYLSKSGVILWSVISVSGFIVELIMTAKRQAYLSLNEYE